MIQFCWSQNTNKYARKIIEVLSDGANSMLFYCPKYHIYGIIAAKDGEKTYKLAGSSKMACTRFWQESIPPVAAGAAGGMYCEYSHSSSLLEHYPKLIDKVSTE